MSARVRLYYPADGFGELICWRLESAYSHATIEFDGKIFSATVPRVVAVGLSDPDFGMPPRKGCCFEIRLTEEEAARALTYCQNMVGMGYDLLAIAGWAFRIQSMQRLKQPYCFELVYDALAVAGVFSTSKRLVTGDQLLVDLYATGRVMNAASNRSQLPEYEQRQKPPVIIPVPPL
ncbi:hypothetical protein MKW11_14980 [Gluconobacter frateurii]|uniref:hypothetical protein n=1 Tax=Gluconobacter frateurii TaxID=38308 RepID=UPI001F054315|nr:hypothetical protein [Gluconobacter frateurii]UMM08469.1 hypothetical protein MKW11_14980 [Gluconobacter frateurii]